MKILINGINPGKSDIYTPNCTGNEVCNSDCSGQPNCECTNENCGCDPDCPCCPMIM